MNKLTKVFALLLVVALASTTFYVGTQFNSTVYPLGDEQNVTPVDLESPLEFDPLHVSLNGESKLHVNESSVYEAVVSGGSGNFSYAWGVEPVDEKVVFEYSGSTCGFMFVVATVDPYTLSVEVADLVSGDKAFDSFTVYDPYTLPDLYLESSLADFVCRVKSDGAGWYFVSDGESGKTVFSSTVLLDATDYALSSTTSGNVLLDGVYFDYSLDVPVGVSVTESVDGLVRVFVNEADRQGSPYTVSVDSVHPTYYLVQDGMGRFINDFTSTNWTTTTQNAVDALTSGRTWKETVKFIGNFESISGYVNVPSYTLLDSTGAYFKYADGVSIRSMFCVLDEEFVEFQGGTLDCNKAGTTDGADHASQNAIYVATGNHITINNVHALNGWKMGFALYGLTNSTISFNTLENFGKEFLDIDHGLTGEAGNNLVIGNKLYGNNVAGEIGVMVDGITGYLAHTNDTISYNQIFNLNIGINVRGINASDNNILYNTIIGGGTGIRVRENSVETRVIGNTLQGVSTAIAVDTSNDNDISENTIDTTTAIGISFNKCNNNTVTKNHIRSAGTSGIYCTAASGNMQYNVFRLNEIFEAGRLSVNHGIAMSVSGDAVAYNNVIEHNLIVGSNGRAVYLAGVLNYTYVRFNDFLDHDLAFAKTADPVNTFVSDNTGYVTENSGSSVNATATVFTIVHGMASTPTGVWASFNTTAVESWTWTSTSTTITVTVVGASLPEAMTCYWVAEYKP